MGRKGIYPPSVKPGIPKLGSRPKGWKRVTFGDVLDVVSRPAELVDDEEYQLVNAKRSRGGIVSREILRGKDIKTKTQFYVSAGDFLISRRQIVHGACGIVPPDLDGALVSNEYSTLQAKDGLSLDFLNWYSHTTHFQQTCFHSSVGVDVEKMVFKLESWLEEPLYLPPFKTQERIVKVLSAWETSIRILGSLLDAKRRLKVGLMNQLLTGKRRFPEFSEKWKKLQLNSVCQEIASGGTPSRDNPEYWTGDIPWISGSDFGEAGIKPFRRFISERGVKESSTRLCPMNSILVVSRTGVGKVALAPCPLAISQDVTVLIPDHEKLDSTFGYYSLSFFVTQLQQFNQGTSINGVRRKDLLQLSIPLPALAEQKRIADVIKVMDVEIGILSESLSALKTQKKGLMQKLLTGQVRVGEE